MITFLASILIWLMFFGLVVLWVVDGKIKKETVIHAIFSCLVAYGITELIKTFFPTLRPFQFNGALPLTLTTPLDGAFPSSHTAVGFALAITIFRHDRKVGVVYLILAGLIGIARILAYVHYPIDIIGGAIIGTLISGLTSSKHFVRLLNR
ncbi:MAG: Bacitracin transport permease protein BCRC [Candidatus Woesebacteria bacterium GW2011_GWA1_33_30]|uniref:Bacitracin transport permease protein BCRC n=1 Tax=Candidatus Woesebacteria bacterium GW2011_GWA2_33_28 TaxID=1618561 RepID=A0A0G0CXW7_9BACT|nr:MAG: Bacitracin transport permease protein BCRC [Candidatus Woesebacteria bacterium GW2011_GWA2_33_28]KKP48975.1 MAG: Bacitracin transport permease protein BCRC [Candidatus Woesebacteria bacterium GW2011_GWA1_33_30]KKP49918.1 MAG: Bacitracin transport permease protein BCRC [Microgenomates group bacterium GW2011_GWC1_33_32]KKP52566.1 MAG: Bacitracin transport permease protein BCRC [Candidatus Woesebacteria bacterium GW2011_GWB1_33_38]KKP56500.1 MAG: Bacitracin transport permease protein BCRC 